MVKNLLSNVASLQPRVYSSQRREEDSNKLLTEQLSDCPKNMSTAATTSGASIDDVPMTVQHSEPGTPPLGPGECITIALIPTAVGGMRRLQERTNLSKTDIANRAIAYYDFIDAHLQAGHELIVRDTRTGDTQVVWFL